MLDIVPIVSSCFDGDTLVATEDGYTRIDEIKEGDKVWAYNIETGELELKEVLKVYVKKNDEILHLEVELDGGDGGYGFDDADRELEIIDTTTNHPFYVIDKGWVAAGDLTIGDEVFTIDGKHATITGMELETLDEAILVYNIEVEDFHTYFVGDGVLVHNACDPNRENYIKHDAYNDARNKIGKSGVDKFINAMKKGLVGPDGQNGIKRLQNFIYEYEIKVKGNFGDYRFFGNFVEELGVIVFEVFGKGLH